MYTFLILSSLGMVFYLVLLVALYREGRRRRESEGTVWKMELETVAEPSERASKSVGSVAAGQRNSSGDVLWIPVTRHHWKPVSRKSGSNRRNLVYLTDPAATQDDRQCG
jgi:ribosomal protein L35AE/L33A